MDLYLFSNLICEGGFFDLSFEKRIALSFFKNERVFVLIPKKKVLLSFSFPIILNVIVIHHF